MTDPQIERKLIEIMRIISESDRPIGARAIADELHNRGYNLGERAVRYHLRILDERGFTHKHGYNGRTITSRGAEELEEALIGDRLDFVITHIEDLIYKVDYNPETGKGNVIVNISYVDKNDFDDAIDIIEKASKVSISPKIALFDEDSPLIHVPAGKVGIATVCSITFDGVLLRNRIPVKPAFGGILEMNDWKPDRFSDLISYSGTSIDPIKIFLIRQPTSVLDVLEKGSGRILANMRTIPVSAAERAQGVLESLAKSEVGGMFEIGGENGNVYGAPVDTDMSGVVVAVGVNSIAAVGEAGIPVNTDPVSTIMKYEDLFLP
ncbi:repressor of nif and glnA expression [Methanohalophilus levihalophilus]|uniref:DUF128 domain-containing protein n=1 Tax=Methanohalophilus levihalophilus TaxID=1431282 RepID=UPI001AE217DF|nr:DUF128 domain-containing protein [Methanohalophilus levihalophilus]MBP2029840.1 repressor of nif and glnA expression [Methanohalophilus levihalophilus]